MTREEAFELLGKNMKDQKNILHSRETEVIMQAVAKELGEDEEFWGITGLLHDLDWEETEKTPDQHSKVTAKILKEAGFPESGIRAIQGHNFEHAGDVERTEKLDYALACSETITGLIYACALVRPDKKLASVEVKSIKKKMKDKSFAATVNRDMIRECEKIGIDLDKFIQISLAAMQGISDELGL